MAFQPLSVAEDPELGNLAPQSQQPQVIVVPAQSQHPIASFFHVAFKLAAVAFYLFSGWFLDSFVVIFVICTLLLAFDFWTVKNITGRLLVGLRWWNEINPADGSSVWRFESRPANFHVHPQDSMLFWASLYLAPLVRFPSFKRFVASHFSFQTNNKQQTTMQLWIVLGIIALSSLKLQWLTVIAVAITLSSANAIGYYRCNNYDAKAGIRSFIASQIIR